MSFTKENLGAIASGNEQNRVEKLKEFLGYPVAQRDPEGGNYWFLHPGNDEDEALETCPIAVGFVDELNDANDKEIKAFLTAKGQKQDIYQHYITRTDIVNKPVMYLLLPTNENTGRIPLILPAEGGLRQRQIETFAWNDGELIARLNRLKQGELPIAESAACLVPQVDWVFYPAAKTSAELARELAKAAREIEQVISNSFKNKTANSYLQKLLASFQKELLPTLQPTSDNEKDYSFADIYAQTIAYALFTARVFSYVTDKRENTFTHFDRESAWKRLPETNPFLRKLFEDISQQSAEDLGDELIAAINDIFGILRAAKMDAILSDFQLKMNREDIVIRFYEDFLAAYKPKMRERRGVYYTPEPVVSYMVRSVDELLKDKFNKPLGLADPDVEILDPACGTGTFLLWIFRLIHERFHNEREAIIARVGDISWSEYVKKHLLNRIYGFELLVAPYAIAHLKLSLFLQETGYEFDSGQRLEIILANTLDTPERKSEVLLGEYISEESDRAVAIKRDQPVMLVIGNPPYSYESENTGEWITSLVRDYYQVDGKPLGERNPKGLQDDYVKFIRFAQWKIQKTGNGILAFITNHSYIDNPTFRGMRQSLKTSFNTIYTLDLHGNSTKKEKCADGSDDKNIFDIQQGVSIGLFLNHQNNNSEFSNFYCELLDSRENKYKWLSKNHVNITNWKNIISNSPSYFFIPQDTTLLQEYEEGWKITDIMKVNSVGFYSARDNFVIHCKSNDIISILKEFISLTVEQAREKYNLGQDAKDWKVSLAQNDIKSSNLDKSKIREFSYRPFDKRFIYYTGVTSGLICRPRFEVMQHLLHPNNLAICFIRRSREQVISNFFVADSLVDKTILSSADNANVAPLFIYSEDQHEQQSLFKQKKQPNLSPEFLNAITSKLGYTPTPEAIFYYIYAIFHSHTYRTRYAEFLKIDFPRVPLTSNNKLFTKLSEYGEELVALHLMKAPKLDKLITKFVENDGNCVVDPRHPKYTNGAVIINKKGDKFINVSEQVWNFYIGGYQVCQKWLKDRKGRTLSSEDIQHYQRIVVALQETIELMDKIDKAIPEFPIA